MRNDERPSRARIENFRIGHCKSRPSLSRSAQAAANLSGFEAWERIVSGRNGETNTKYVRGDRFLAQFGGIEQVSVQIFLSRLLFNDRF